FIPLSLYYLFYSYYTRKKMCLRWVVPRIKRSLSDVRLQRNGEITYNLFRGVDMEKESITLSRVNKNKKNKKLKSILISFIFLIGLGLFAYISILFTGSSIVGEDAFNLNETTVLETANGTPVAELYKENRKYITINEIPEHVQQAYIAIEDRRFYEHK